MEYLNMFGQISITGLMVGSDFQTLYGQEGLFFFGGIFVYYV